MSLQKLYICSGYCPFRGYFSSIAKPNPCPEFAKPTISISRFKKRDRFEKKCLTFLSNCTLHPEKAPRRKIPNSCWRLISLYTSTLPVRTESINGSMVVVSEFMAVNASLSRRERSERSDWRRLLGD